MKKLTLLFLCAVVACLILAPNAVASQSCYFCNTSGHGGGNPCGLGPIGSGNLAGCFCHYNSATKKCTMSGNPCSCVDDPGAGWLCSCTQPPAKTSNAATIPNIQREYRKWRAIIKDEEQHGALRSDARLIFHARSETCIEGGGAFLVGMSLAAAETGHPVKFVFGDSSHDSPQDRIDQGLPPVEASK